MALGPRKRCRASSRLQAAYQTGRPTIHGGTWRRWNYRFGRRTSEAPMTRRAMMRNEQSAGMDRRRLLRTVGMTTGAAAVALLAALVSSPPVAAQSPAPV